MIYTLSHVKKITQMIIDQNEKPKTTPLLDEKSF